MLFYDITDKRIKFYYNDKYLGFIDIPKFTSSLFKEIYLKICIILASTCYPNYTKISLPTSKVPFNFSDLNLLNTYRRALSYKPMLTDNNKLTNKIDTFLGKIEKKHDKHILFFSGGKESFYKLFYLLELEKVKPEDILIIYINKWNNTFHREAKTLYSLSEMFGELNIKVIDISTSLPSMKTRTLEYVLMFIASLEHILLFNGGCNIHWGFSKISWEKQETYIDSYSETIECEQIIIDYLKNFEIKINPFKRLEIKEHLLYDYSLFKKNNVIKKMTSCIVSDGLASLSRGRFKKDYPIIYNIVDENTCGYCSKCILKTINYILDKDVTFLKENKEEIKNYIAKSITNKLVPIQKQNKEFQFFNYDIHFLSYLYSAFSKVCEKINK